MKNIEIFKATSAVVIADLYAAFPLPKTLTSSEIALQLGEDLWDEATREDPDRPGFHYYQRQYSPASLAAPTIEWLAAAGLITYSSSRQGVFEKAVLTPKGLEAIEAESGRGDSLVKAAGSLVKDASKDAAKEQLKAVFSEILKWCVEKSPSLLHVVSRTLGS